MTVSSVEGTAALGNTTDFYRWERSIRGVH